MADGRFSDRRAGRRPAIQMEIECFGLLLGLVKPHVNLSIGLSLLAFVYLFSSSLVFVARKLSLAKDYYREREPLTAPV